MPDRSIWVCPSRYRRLSTASVASLLRQNSKPAIADNALFPRLFRASQVYICRKTFGYLLSGIVLAMWRFARGQHRWVYGLLLTWLICGYLFFTLIRLKEPRDTIMVLLPFAVAA